MKKILCIATIVFILCMFASCKKSYENIYVSDMPYSQEITLVVSEDSDNLKFFKLPSPPVYKQTYNTDEINNIYNFIETYPKERVSTSINKNGWIYYLEFSNGMKISYCENSLFIDDKQYVVSNKFEDELSALYATIKTEEKLYSSNN